MKITDFPVDPNELVDQVADVRSYAKANETKYNWGKVADLSDDAIGEAIGKRKNSRGAIYAVFDALKGEVATPAPAEPEAPAEEVDPAAEKRARKAAQAKARRAAKKAMQS